VPGVLLGDQKGPVLLGPAGKGIRGEAFLPLLCTRSEASYGELKSVARGSFCLSGVSRRIGVSMIFHQSPSDNLRKGVAGPSPAGGGSFSSSSASFALGGRLVLAVALFD